VVSGAGGAVGGVVGQIAKLKGCRVVGIAGGAEKCSYITELGFDAAIDYKSENVMEALGEQCPKGVDVYFDNVGGEILDAALAHLARHARVILCGAISQYNNTEAMKGPSNYMALLVNHASMTGFVFSDYLDRLGEAATALGGWVAKGELSSREDIAEGFENFPETLLRLFSGANTGKLVLKVGGD
jgi:NADPH-dependent curcumin reductase CurA